MTRVYIDDAEYMRLTIKAVEWQALPSEVLFQLPSIIDNKHRVEYCHVSVLGEHIAAEWMR